jgi:hypothetical protein
MTNQKRVSSKYLIQRLLANHSVNNSNEINNMIDWMGQAIRFIGKHAGYDVCVIDDVYVDNHHTEFPCNMEGLIAIWYKGILLPLGADSSGIGFEKNYKFQSGSNKNIADNETILALNQLNQTKETLINEYSTTPTQELADAINEIAKKIYQKEVYINTMNQYQYGRRYKGEGEFYNIKTDCIQTSFNSGFIDIVCTKLPLDEEGFPLIIDNEFYIQAIEWYLILMLIQKGYSHPLFDYQTVYTMFWGGSKLEPFGWRAKAANNVRIPSIQDAERFTRMWENFRLRRELPNQSFNRAEQTFGTTY